MQRFDPELLDTSRGDLLAQTGFHATPDAHGRYDRYDGLRFVVRLSPRVHKLIATLPNGILSSKALTFEQIQAFSTYLHEIIHWWQHIGSTCGFMLSLSYPAQTHANLNHLRRFLEQVGPVKSIRAWAASHPGSPDLNSPSATANTIINNQFDIEAYRLLATNPDRAKELINSSMFESVGHTYSIALANGIFALASTFDQDFALLPDPRVWEKEFGRLREKREPGFYWGSPVCLSPIGAFHIFEAQARFAQLQYLYFGSGGAFDWEVAKDAGMLTPTYMSAFEYFLARTGLTRPETIGHPIVGLFMLVCDIAINPAEGFPLPVLFPNSFLTDVDPGMRFIYLATIVKLYCPETARVIEHYDAAEYEEVSTKLCRVLTTSTPLEIATEIKSWAQRGEAFHQCLTQHDIGKADARNPPLQVLFGQFLSYAHDKARHPHILCWPGAHMAGAHVNDDGIGVFSRQSPLFIDRAEDETIAPLIRAGVKEADIGATFEAFYGGHALYDLTRQWITARGLFGYDYRWLQPDGTYEQGKAWADHIFTNSYGVSPDDFTLLTE